MKATGGTPKVNSLLPKGLSDFHSKRYWNEFFSERERKQGGGGAFEWYGEYRPNLQALLTKTIAPKSQRILNVGCGNSELSSDMYDDGFENQVNVDFSEVVIEEMSRKNKHRTNMKFLIMDLRSMTEFVDASFDVVLDKGALDAIYSFEDDQDENQGGSGEKETKKPKGKDRKTVEEDVEKMMKEISRVIPPGGSYLCITLAQHYILDFLLHFFSKGWKIRFHQVPTDSAFLPFLISFTKNEVEHQTQPSSIETFFTSSSSSSSSPSSSSTSISEIKEQVKDLQLEKHTEERLKKWNSSGCRIPIQLWSTDSSLGPRYNITILDQSQWKKTESGQKERRKFTGNCAVFIVPQGKEHEWVFESEEGQTQLADQTNYRRLIIVAMQHGHKYESMETVKAELSPRVMEMMIFEEAKGGKETFPFLTTSEGLGTRSLVARLVSKMNGELFVEDVPYDSSVSSNNEEKEKKQNPVRKGRGGTKKTEEKKEEKETGKRVFRRLIFGSNSNLIQSEAKVTLFDDAPSAPSAPSTTPAASSSSSSTPSTDLQASEDGQKKKKKKNKKKKKTTATGDQVTTSQESPANTTPTSTSTPAPATTTPAPAPKQAVKPQQQQKAAQKKYEVDYGYLTCQHHRTIVAGLSLLYPFFPSNPSSKEELGIVIVGLGGGSLPMFLHRFISQSMVEVVELDPVVGEVAKKFFGFNEGARMKLHIDDGLEYIKKTAQQHRTLSSSSTPSSSSKQKQIKKKNVVILDADSKDLSTGMSCPPSGFIEEEFLGKELKEILSPEGMLVVNLVCRSPTMKLKVLGNLKKHFQEVHEIQVSEEELNTIVFAFPTIRKNPRALSKLDLVENMGYITKLMETSDAVGWQRNAFNLEECLKGINLPETTSAKKGGGKGKKRK